MANATRFTLQALLAGVVAAAIVLGARGLASEAQWGESAPESTEGGAAADSSAPHACDILTEADAEDALGVSVTQVPDPTQCTYVADDLSARGLSLALTSALPQQAETMEASMKQIAHALGGEHRELTGNADSHAVLSEYMSQATTLRGEQAVAVVLTAPSGSYDDQTVTLTDLTNLALSRL